MIYTHFKTHFHHLSGVKQHLLKSDLGLHIPESSQVMLLRPAAAEVFCSSWQQGNRVASLSKQIVQALCVFPVFVLLEKITSLSRKTFSVFGRLLLLLQNGKTEIRKRKQISYLGTLS